MTLLNQRIALAGVMGMEGPWLNPDEGSLAGAYYYNPKGQRLPELTLDWLHEVEATLPKENVDLRSLYYDNLALCVPYWPKHRNDTFEHEYSLVVATKEQRSEALLRTLGLWKEEPE